MIQFQDSVEKHGSSRTESLDRFKDIKSMESSSPEKIRDFWDSLFGKRDTYVPDENENLFAEVFGRSSDEFHFDFDMGQKLSEGLEDFNDDKWSRMTEAEQIKTIKDFSSALSEKLGLVSPPTIAFFNGPRDSCGAYNPGTNGITINRALFDDPAEIVDTIAHETWHAYQHQRANILENKHDYLYKLNFDNYISPTSLGDGKYLFFTDYQEQLVEAEARAFASLFREGVVLL